MSADEAAELVPSRSTVVVDGSGGGVNQPDVVLAALARRFARTAEPRDLCVVHPSGLGDDLGGGVDRLADPRLVTRVIGGHWRWTPRMQILAAAGEIEAYCLPQGVLSHLMREIAGGRPGVITRTGLGTTVDPRVDGGRLNAAATADLVEIVHLAGREHLFFPAFPVDVAIVKGSVADEVGNISLDDEGLFAEVLSVAQAASNSGGVVIAQVNAVVQAGSLDPRRVKVPRILVDAVVVAPDVPLSAATREDPELTGAARPVAATNGGAGGRSGPLDQRAVIARRAAAELRSGDVVNLGYGMPDGVTGVLDEAGVLDRVALTVEQGHIGGLPQRGSDFGLVRGAEATLDAGYQFDFYDGGGLDLAVLSFAELDIDGNVNVGRFGNRIPGVGGFINIAQGAKRVVFVGTFTTAKAGYRFRPDRVSVPPGGGLKLVARVQQIAFSGRLAMESGKSVRYVTERAVLELRDGRPELIEIAPGVDLQRDVLDRMAFRPSIAKDLRPMAAWLFDEAANLASGGARQNRLTSTTPQSLLTNV